MLYWAHEYPAAATAARTDGRIAAGEGLGEDAQPHHTLPLTSASLTRWPVSTDRAIATIA